MERDRRGLGWAPPPAPAPAPGSSPSTKGPFGLFAEPWMAENLISAVGNQL
jgi:hypothetical protein